MKKTFFFAASAAALVLAAVSCGPSAKSGRTPLAASEPAGPISETTVAQGRVRGVIEDGIATYWAIPFAEAPVGELRWKAPVPKEPWTGVRECAEPAGMPPQQTRSWPGAPAPKVTEDCLYLNIQTPAKSAGDKLPVLVWIHGGGFITGDANSNNGIHFAEQGIVYVSLSYRTGALGFLSLPELTAENPRHISGNYGLLDMIEGLKWVQKNIAAFGGDPAKVTIMGESAGAIAVSMLCASPLAKGLFRGAISESGGSFCPVDAVRVDNNGIRDVRGSEEYGMAWMNRIGVSSLSELRETGWEKLVSDEQSGGVGGFWPTVDGYVLPDDQYKMYEAGNYNDVNVLIGTNSDEGSMFVRPTQLAKYQEDIRAEYGPFAERMLELYPAASDEETFAALSDIFRETAFSWPTWAWASLQHKTGKGKVYLYYFDQFNENGGFGSPGAQRRKPRGAGHASELSYVFGSSWGRPFEGADKTVSDAMNRYWANFVKTGDPNGAGLDNWPVYQDGTKSVMFFKNGTSLIETPNRPQLELMEEYFAWKRQQPIRVIALPSSSGGENVEFEQNDNFYNVSRPTMTLVPAKNADGLSPAMLVCPGGGYLFVGKNSEGFNVADALAEKGITCFVLKYRTRPLGTNKEESLSNLRSLMPEIMQDDFTEDGQKTADDAFEDALAAIRIIRDRAEEFGVDPQRVGIVGFSAGANLAMRVALHHPEESAPSIIAPIYLWHQKDYTVPDDAAPLFLCAPQRDLCPTDMSYNMYKAWSEKGLPAEIHVITGSGHGFGYQGGKAPSDIWMKYFLSFLSRIRFIGK